MSFTLVFGKPLSHVSGDDLERLVESGRQEDKYLEYKRDLPAKDDRSRREFLADVVSFANASGGIILYGIDERRKGVSKINGLQGINIDEQIRLLEDLMRNGIEPRIMGARIHPISLGSENTVLALEIPKSWNGPHAVNYKNHWRFYIRDSAGKHPVDVAELRSLFEMADTLIERVKRFRAERLLRIAAGETPIPLPSEKQPVVALHIIPVASFASGSTVAFELQKAKQLSNYFASIWGGSSCPSRYNLEGLLFYLDLPQYKSYTQLFRSGAVEFILVYPKWQPENTETLVMGAQRLSQEIVKSVKQSLNGLSQLGVVSPVFVSLTILNAKDVYLGKKHQIKGVDLSPYTIDRDCLDLPDVLIEDMSVDSAPAILRPVFDALWNAVGWERCGYYDDRDGRWLLGESP